MKKQVSTEKAPAAIGPYSQAVCAGDFIFTSGQLPINPENGQMEPDDISKQTARSIENLKAVLNAAGADLCDIVKTTVFLSDMNNFAAMNAVYAEYIKDCILPARSAVQVARLPKDALVEIEAVAVKK